MQTEIEIAKFDTLEKIVEQLESCNYETEAGYLQNNTAFIALKRIAAAAIIIPIQNNAFRIMAKMNMDDAINNTKNLQISNALVSAKKAPGGGHVTDY